MVELRSSLIRSELLIGNQQAMNFQVGKLQEKNYIYRPVYEPSGSKKCWEILEWLSDWLLLKKGSAPWS
jgi:hypothetical protein